MAMRMLRDVLALSLATACTAFQLGGVAAPRIAQVRPVAAIMVDTAPDTAAVLVPVDGIRELDAAGEAHLARLLEKTPDKTMA